MKTKFLMVLCLAVFSFLVGCKGSANTNVANAAMNANMTAPVTKTNESAMTDSSLKPKIEAALKAKGFVEVTVDTSTTPATLRGTYPKERIAEVMATAMEANGGKPVQNQASGK